MANHHFRTFRHLTRKMAHTLLLNLRGSGRERAIVVNPFLGRWVAILFGLIFANSVIVVGQPDSIYRLPAGTRIRAKLEAEINSHVSSVDDTFLAFVSTPVSIRDAIVLPVGTVIEGRVRGVRRAGAAGQAGQMDLVFETLKLSNESRHIDGVMVTKFGTDSSKTVSLWSILGGAAVGAAVGGSTHSAGGALIGAAAGAGIGSGVWLLRRGKDVRLKRNEVFEIELRSPVVLPVSDY